MSLPNRREVQGTRSASLSARAPSALTGTFPSQFQQARQIHVYFLTLGVTQDVNVVMKTAHP